MRYETVFGKIMAMALAGVFGLFALLVAGVVGNKLMGQPLCKYRKECQNYRAENYTCSQAPDDYGYKCYKKLN